MSNAWAYMRRHAPTSYLKDRVLLWPFLPVQSQIIPVPIQFIVFSTPLLRETLLYSLMQVHSSMGVFIPVHRVRLAFIPRPLSLLFPVLHAFLSLLYRETPKN